MRGTQSRLNIGDGHLIWFFLFIIFLVVFDLTTVHKKSQTISFKNNLLISLGWIALALLFNAFIWLQQGSEKALQFFAGYIIEKSLSVDNLFVFILIFKNFHIPPQLQHRVLFYGIFGALIFRAVMIYAGIELINHFEPIVYLFGVFLIYAGWKSIFDSSEEGVALRWGKKLDTWIPFTDQLHGNAFLVRTNAKAIVATPLLLALITIELADIVFAVDSIPAVLAITKDPFIVLTSNVFAILGLRALYFTLSPFFSMFATVQYAVGAILIFVGLKFLLAPLIHIPTSLSIGIIVSILLFAILMSKKAIPK